MYNLDIFLHKGQLYKYILIYNNKYAYKQQYICLYNWAVVPYNLINDRD